ncbi:hypothetical protein, partial [Billgrantia desiderata]|uniref:hypothetical protein n=1 Tax=Billgrantia desiderata TaxID=52021 RepID=UPI0028A1F1D0
KSFRGTTLGNSARRALRAMPGAPKKTAHGVMGGKIETASQSNSVSDCHRAVACIRYDSSKQKSSPLFDNFLSVCHHDLWRAPPKTRTTAPCRLSRHEKAQ